MAKTETKIADNPKLKTKEMSDGNLSLYLDYYLGRVNVLDDNGDVVSKVKRKREFLKLTLFANPKTPIERQQNKDILLLAQKIRFEREQELRQGQLGYSIAKPRKINFLEYCQTYIDEYTKKDKRNIQLAFRWFRDFLEQSPRYHNYKDYITPSQIDKDLVLAFVEYLQKRSRGEGANTAYKRFKKVVIYATEHDIFKKNPCRGISIPVDKSTLQKEILSLDEVAKLIATNPKGLNADIRRAFIFCLYTGIRFCDVKELTFSDVDYSNKLLTFNQIKVKHSSTASSVTIPLNEGLMQLIGEPSEGGSRVDKVFNLPSHTMCLKALRKWVSAAGIEKHITWHCARHSFAVNVLMGGANVKVVASLLGHSSIQMTDKYLRAVDSAKRQAIESLPKLPTMNNDTV